MKSGSDQADATGPLFERPQYRDRVKQRFLYVLVPCLIANYVGGRNSGFTGFLATWAEISTACAATGFAALLTLLVGLVPAKRRRTSRPGAHDYCA